MNDQGHCPCWDWSDECCFCEESGDDLDCIRRFDDCIGEGET